ncbi:MAG: LysR family transcriptional regulator [Mesorhizobium sp.]|uniref:LysR family transcriptional regulator n=1 Tax=Mesorhizobium sp. TaxID=1871066 RepID=UPI000FE6C729|nr:LysR family transcriptional regulator [Mesorhizobium sp.]RWI50528.1 MAG: LysR family transcriptional regulator [Mesorhizobium sp.]
MNFQSGLDKTQDIEGDTGVSAATLDRKLAGVDLNLLVALEVLLTCRNVTHAARKIGQTQPAMSRALARLRELLGDDLLVRSSTGLKLTARAEYLASIVPAAMSNVRDVISSRLAITDAKVTVRSNLMPAVLPRLLLRSAGGNESIKINIHKSNDEGLAQLRARTAQFMLGGAPEAAPDIRSETIVSEEFVTLVAFKNHALGGIRPTADAFLELTHINLVENGVELFPQFAEALIAHGSRRPQLFEVPDITAAALMVSEGKLALSVPRSIAGWLTKTLPLSLLLPPIPIPYQEISISWLAEAQNDDRKRLVDDLILATKEGIIEDQAPLRVLRAMGS